MSTATANEGKDMSTATGNEGKDIFTNSIAIGKEEKDNFDTDNNVTGL